MNQASQSKSHTHIDKITFDIGLMDYINSYYNLMHAMVGNRDVGTMPLVIVQLYNVVC